MAMTIDSSSLLSCASTGIAKAPARARTQTIFILHRVEGLVLDIIPDYRETANVSMNEGIGWGDIYIGPISSVLPSWVASMNARAETAYCPQLSGTHVPVDAGRGGECPRLTHRL